MESVIVQAHPDPDSFCAACATAVARSPGLGPTISTIDLYADDFCPVLLLDELRRRYPWEPLTQGYIRQLTSAGLIVFVYPEWWGSPPAILKGMLDRVLRPEIAYRFEEGRNGKTHPVGLWQDKILLPVITTDSEADQAQIRAGLLWRSAADFCGARLADVIVFGPVYSSSNRQRRQFLDRLPQLVSGYCQPPKTNATE
ncbi:NAD(P)H-dependent oxidoreductase [Spirochaeta africana]|uniref:Putative NADPH-quinone reductase (Modulator of drug activity B) n=1 Tax=Spirochaeta africana (strain ATCC 700263 / DSM 8902 / Z-7692) TaxID=889378 RepID=H9UJR7_SPIAZ|nr:NAD(P)H-dependent oxidoreductase [Spirochaeta africana]AFG37760.1 putative NADPH-quinone reductase (modulator of drug activity B) [Spirochaeta africana DSM 8902]